MVVITLAATLNQLLQLLLKKKQLLTHGQIVLNENDVNSDTPWLNQTILYHIKHGSHVRLSSIFHR